MDIVKAMGVSVGVLAVALILMYGLNECGRPTAPVPTVSGAPLAYGENVYYFEAVDDFGSKLAEYLRANPDMHIVSMASLNNGVHGSTRGYWVVVEKRRIEK